MTFYLLAPYGTDDDERWSAYYDYARCEKVIVKKFCTDALGDQSKVTVSL
jgi:hypothetical protein